MPYHVIDSVPRCQIVISKFILAVEAFFPVEVLLIKRPLDSPVSHFHPPLLTGVKRVDLPDLYYANIQMSHCEMATGVFLGGVTGFGSFLFSRSMFRRAW